MSGKKSGGQERREHVVRRAKDFDPFADQRITPQHHDLLERIGEGVQLDHLGTLGSSTSVDALLAELQAWGAVGIEGSDWPPPAAGELGDLSQDEQRLLGERVDLDDVAKRRLIAARRSLDGGTILEFMGVGNHSDRRALRRAYFDLAKEFHPDRFRGMQLGSFGPLVGEVFATASQAVKALSDSRTTTSSALARPHRRRSRRMVFRGRVAVRTQSWDGAIETTTHDLSRGGMFVVCDRTAKAGEAVIVELQTRNGALRLRGTVAWCRPASEAERLDLDAGMGVRLDTMSDEVAAQWEKILERVSELDPVPARELPGASPRGDSARSMRARGTGSFRRPPVVGIDMGTTYTSICAMLGNRVTLLPWPDGSISIPSVVSFPAPGRHVVGRAARDRLLTDPRHTIASAKRLLGRRADDRAIAGHLGQVAYGTATGPDGYVLAEMWGEHYHMAQICSYILSAARNAAEQALDDEVREAVLAIPTSYTPERLDILRRAAQLAQLEVVDVIEEPNAAALANRSYPDFGGLIGIYDFGGGTFDFSVVDASSGDFRVLATTGDSWLGGDDLDLCMAEALADLVWRERNVDLRNRAVEWQRLLFSCEQAKCKLSKVDLAEVVVEEYTRTHEGARDLRVRVRRAQTEALWAPAIERTIATANQALTLLGLQPSDLAQIYLSGGSTYTPAVRSALAARFHVPVRSLVPPEYAVCLGTGVLAGTIERRRPQTVALSR